MSLTHEDIQQLKKELDERYVLITDCDDRQQVVNSKFADRDIKIDRLILQQKINNYLTTAIASGIIALVIKVFLGG